LRGRNHHNVARRRGLYSIRTPRFAEWVVAMAPSKRFRRGFA
jgi:hypothetical protein